MRASLFALPLCLALAAMVPSAVKAAEMNVMADACGGCHGTDGQSVGAMPSFIGKDAATLEKFLIEYKTGKREATVMDRITKGYSDEQLKAISAFYASRAKK